MAERRGGERKNIFSLPFPPWEIDIWKETSRHLWPGEESLDIFVPAIRNDT